MRMFRDLQGRFVINLPSFWEYKEGSNSSLAQFVSKQNPESCFQISFLNSSQGAIPKALESRDFVKNTYYSEITFTERDIISDDIQMVVREAHIGDYFILAAYITSTEERNSKIVVNEIEQMDVCLKSLRVAEKVDWPIHIADARFNHFMISLLASIDLKNKAMENGSQIELVILSANQIDALLRISLILQKQLEDKNKIIDVSLIFQGVSDKPIFEKEIYNLARQNKIITEAIYNELVCLYEIRNRVVHRYIISDLKTNDVVNLVVKYMDMDQQISKIVKKYEQEQYKKKIGIYGTINPFDPISHEDMPGLLAQLHEKHGNSQIIKKSTIK